MMQLIDLRDSAVAADMRRLVPRAKVDAAVALETVLPLVRAVRDTGVAALQEQAAQFDGVSGHAFRVPQSVITAAVESVDPDLLDVLRLMIRRVRQASVAQIPAPEVTEIAAGATVSLRWQPVDRVGLYVPGGKAVYPSSVIMNAVPALAAGVKSIALASPVQPETRSVHPTILAAAALCGVTEIYAIGGAGAVAAFAYGVPEIGMQPVDIITGPGNIYVAAAKRAVTGVVGIDSEAGTTEIMVLADATSNPAYVAADLLSQAEHDEAAASVLVTTSPECADRVLSELAAQLAETPNSERAGTALAGQQSAVILVRDTAQMCAVANAYGAEHLSIQTADPADTLGHISNAGAIFIGGYAPVSLGDYLAGSNHVLPTGGTSRFSSGLGAHTFLRPQQLIDYSADALAEVTDSLVKIATAEGLPAHGAAAQIRTMK